MKTTPHTRPAAPIATSDPSSAAGSPLYTVPDWARPNPVDASLESAVFYSAICLKTLDDLVRSHPVWLGCFRARQVLVCAHAACQWLRLKADVGALRDAVLLCGTDGDPGPAGRVYQITRKLSRRAPVLSSKTILVLAQALGLQTLSDPDLTSLVELLETAQQTRQSPPLAAAALITTLYHLNPDLEILAWILADAVITVKLGWSTPVPLLLSARFDPVLRLRQGRGRMTPDDPDFARALCLALGVAIRQALNSANTIARHASTLQVVAPKLRSKGAQTIIQHCLPKTVFWRQRLSVGYHAGQRPGFLQGWKALARCANCQAGPASRFTGFDHGNRKKHATATLRQKANRSPFKCRVRSV